MPRITISYRRDDSGVITGRIFDRLAAHYGRDAVFRDIDNIPPGVDFRQHIAKVLDESDILLAIVGPRWLGARGGVNRLDDEADPVRLEIETGLRKEMPVIPVLVLRAGMPKVGQLPETVKDFAYRHAVQVDAGQDFDIHSARLIRAMDRILQQQGGLLPPSGGDLAELPGAAGLVPSLDEDDAPLNDPPYAPGLVEARPRPQPAAPERREPVAVVTPVQAPAPRDAVTPAPAGQRRGGLVLGALAGLIVGAGVAAAVVISLRPAAPADVMALATAKEALETKALTLQAELTAAQKKLETTQSSLDAAQKQASDAAQRAEDLQATADQAQKALAAQQDVAAKAKAEADKLTAQVKALGDQQANQQARADQDEKTLAAQKSASTDAAAQLALAQDQAKTFGDKLAKAQDQMKTLGDQLTAEKKAHQDAADQASQLGGQVKALQAQITAAPAPANQAAAAPAPSTAAPAPPTDDSSWNADQRKQAQTDLVTVGYMQGTPDGNFGAATRAAIKQLQSLTGQPETGVLTDPEASALHDMAQRLSALLNRGATSPDGVPAAAVKGAGALYQRAWTAEKGSNGASDPAEAIYWYGLAAAEGDSKALTNLGTLLIRGQGIAKPDADGATVLWEAAAARGEVTAMFNLGAMYERGVGVAADPDKAKAWYGLGAARGDTGAKAALKRLGG